MKRPKKFKTVLPSGEITFGYDYSNMTSKEERDYLRSDEVTKILEREHKAKSYRNWLSGF